LDIFIAFILGVVQGLTEFLPVSSSGHLEIVKSIFATDFSAKESMLMTVVLHFATALSTIFIFRTDIIKILAGLFSKGDKTERIFSTKIVVSMIPAVIIGLLWEDIIENLFNGNLILVGLMLIITAFLLFLADRSKPTNKEVSFKNSFIIGIAQAIAVLPGISRSGATIATSVLLGVDKESAARFSFLMVVPLIFGKMFKDIIDGALFVEQFNFIHLFIGFLAAFFTGIFACNWMIKLVKNSQLKYFSFYCLFIALATLTWACI
jgi:undecaprenyl-diphosphatase